jgi:hypothetical protein
MLEQSRDFRRRLTPSMDSPLIPSSVLSRRNTELQVKKSIFRTGPEPAILAYSECAAIPGKDLNCQPVWTQHPRLVEGLEIRRYNAEFWDHLEPCKKEDWKEGDGDKSGQKERREV